MAKKRVSLYIDDTSLRLMVTQDQQIKRWAESSLEPGLVDNNVVIGEAEVTARIKQLFEGTKVKTKKIDLCLSGLRCLTRPITLPRLPKEMLDEAVTREAQRVVPVPVEELYISWQTIPTAPEQTRVFMVGIPRKTVDALFRVLQHAGVSPGFMEIKPLLLTRAVRETTAIIVDVQATEFDIVVMVDGIPQPIRSIRFASGALSINENVTTLKNEIDRTLTFYNTNNPEKTLAPTVPVFACGDLANKPELYQPISEAVGHPVLPLPSPLECPEGLDASHYMANMGLALQRISLKKKTGATAITLNALPTVYQTKAVSLINVLAIPSIVVAISLLVFASLFALNISDDITSINTRLNSTNQLLQQKESQRQQLSELQKKVSGLTASQDSLTSFLDTLSEQAKATEGDLAAAIAGLPPGISLSSIRYTADALTITAKSPNEKQILSYSTNLDTSSQFRNRNIVITDMTRTESGDIVFSLICDLQTQSVGASGTKVALASLPVGVNLTGVHFAEYQLTLNGIAPDADKFLSYLRALEASGTFTDITVTSMTITETGDLNFAMVLKTGE